MCVCIYIYISFHINRRVNVIFREDQERGVEYHSFRSEVAVPVSASAATHVLRGQGQGAPSQIVGFSSFRVAINE